MQREKTCSLSTSAKAGWSAIKYIFFRTVFRKVHYNCALSRVSEQCSRDTQVVRSLWIFCYGGRGRERRWSFRCKVCDQVNLGGKLLSLLGIFNSFQFSWFCPKQFTHVYTLLNSFERGAPFLWPLELNADFNLAFFRVNFVFSLQISLLKQAWAFSNTKSSSSSPIHFPMHSQPHIKILFIVNCKALLTTPQYFLEVNNHYPTLRVGMIIVI